jgi:succinyl-CoA synthetase beta subunit
MNIHEYQAKDVLKKYGVPIPQFRVVNSVEGAAMALKEMGIHQAVVKAQVHAGGRGKAGGVKFGKTVDEVLAHAKKIIGMRMVTKQTGAEGVPVHEVMISDPVDIKKEYYLGATIDREHGQAMLIASPEGGVEIEEVAEKNPEKILTLPIELDGSVKRFRLTYLAKFMGWSGDQAKQGIKIVTAVAKAFMDTDASLLEINPLVETDKGAIVALDAKLSIDSNALYRQETLAKMYDPTQYSDLEVRAKQHDLAYIALDGNIGCMVNGAGLAMATMDVIYHYGAYPANFLDVGGGASQEKVAEGFKILLSDPKVKGILVNIFGGIMDCEVLAKGIVAAAREVHISVPLIVRLEGTNFEKGKRILAESKLSIITADDLGEAAKKAVEAVKGSK